MGKFIFKRLMMMLFVFFGVTLFVFFLMSLAPGDPATIILGEQAAQEDIEALREELGLNKPLLVRYVKYVWDIVHLDFGLSYKTRQPVIDSILEMLPNTLLLGVSGLLIAVVIGISVGIISAKKQYSLLDNSTMVCALIGVSMPNFWQGLLYVLLFSLTLKWLPSSGMGQGFVPLLKSLILPALTIGASSAASIVRMTRSTMLEVIRQDYIDTARAKGVSEKVITYRHMLRNAMIPIVTTVGLQFGGIVGGAVLTETVFSWPGLGRYMVDSIKSRDVPAVLGTVVFIAVSLSFVNLFIDILYAFLDPRIKSQYKSEGRVKRVKKEA